jgi:hypothetical protein
MDLINRWLTPKNPLLATGILVGALIGIGTIANNSNTQNKVGLSPLAIDTSVVGPLSQGDIKSLWEQWRLNANTANNPAWPGDHVFNYCYNQFSVGGNVLQANDPILSLFGYSNIETFTTSYGSGWYIVVVSTNATNNIQYATLFRVVANVDTNATTVPNNVVTLPNQMALSYVNVIENTNGSLF